MIFQYLKQYGQLINQEKTTTHLAELKFKYLGLYFTADWCSYCWKLVKVLPQLVKKVNKEGQDLHLITVRLDDSYQSDFAYNYWKFSNNNLQKMQELASRLSIRFVPSIVIYDRFGRLITADGLIDMQKYQDRTIQYWDEISKEKK